MYACERYLTVQEFVVTFTEVGLSATAFGVTDWDGCSFCVWSMGDVSDEEWDTSGRTTDGPVSAVLGHFPKVGPVLGIHVRNGLFVHI